MISRLMYRPTPRLLVVHACFLLSGFAALLYQTAWTREFAFVFGTTELAIAAVLAGYMGGLAVGAAIAGHLARYLHRPLLTYALLELGIGVAAIAIPIGIRAATALSVLLFGGQAEPPDAGGIALTAYTVGSALSILAVPTVLMGATLPILVRYAAHDEARLGAIVGGLYATNTIGAVVGTVTAGFVLLPQLGLRRTVWIGVVANLIAAIMAAPLARRSGTVAADARTAPPPVPAWDRMSMVLPIMLVSGLASFVYEVLWTRLLGQLLGGSPYAFATMLATFLAGIALGSAAASRLVRSRFTAVLGLAVTELGVAVLSVLAFWLMDRLPELGWGARLDSGPQTLHYAAVAALVLLPSTLCIGASYPLAVRALAASIEEAARASARVYAWNTVGAVVGALAAGFWIIPAFGFAATALAMASVNVTLALAACLIATPRPRRLVAACVAAGVAIVLFRPSTPWTLLRYRPMTADIASGRVVFDEVGRSATVMVLETPRGWQLTNNGLPESTILPFSDPRDMSVAKWLVVLPTLARPQARDLLVIGFGGGKTIEVVPPNIHSVDVIEIEAAVIDANRSVRELRYKDPLADPRVRIIINDARAALALTDKRYDIIVSQPSHPWTVGSSSLYTRDFFGLVRQRLKPDGVFVQWMGARFVDAPLFRTLLATMRDAFAHVRVYEPPPRGAFLLLASDSPLEVEKTASEVIPACQRELVALGIFDVADVAASLVLDTAGVEQFAAGAPINTHDFNLLQMHSPPMRDHNLARRGASPFPAELDPLPQLADALMLRSPYLLRRLMERHEAARALAIIKTAPTEHESSVLKAATYLFQRRAQMVRSEVARAEQTGADSLELQELLVRIWLASPQRQWQQVEPVVRRAPPYLQAIALGWKLEQEKDWQALRGLEEALAQTPPTSLLFQVASGLRARWRTELGVAPQETVDILAEVVAWRGLESDRVALAEALTRAGQERHAAFVHARLRASRRDGKK